MEVYKSLTLIHIVACMFSMAYFADKTNKLKWSLLRCFAICLAFVGSLALLVWTVFYSYGFDRIFYIGSRYQLNHAFVVSLSLSIGTPLLSVGLVLQQRYSS